MDRQITSKLDCARFNRMALSRGVRQTTKDPSGRNPIRSFVRVPKNLAKIASQKVIRRNFWSKLARSLDVYRSNPTPKDQIKLARRIICE